MTIPQDGTPVLKHVAVGTYHELCFMIYIVLYFIVFVDHCVECTGMNSINSIKLAVLKVSLDSQYEKKSK